jgi:hypothetical protein
MGDLHTYLTASSAGISFAHKIREETGNILPCSLFVTSEKELRSEDPWASEHGVKKLRVSGVEHGV